MTSVGSKVHDLSLAFAVARKWPDVLSNALEPRWVAAKMGGPGAPDDLDAGPNTQVWLATSNRGQYFYYLGPATGALSVWPAKRGLTG